MYCSKSGSVRILFTRYLAPALTTCAFWLSFSALMAQSPDDQLILNNHSYVREGGSWYQLDQNGTRFPVDMEVITVKFKAAVPESSVAALNGSLGTTPIRGAVTGFIDLRVDPSRDIFQTVAAYLDSGLVENAELNTLGFYTIIPDDPNYAQQWHHPVIQSDQAWDKQTGDPAIIVAILDSGTEFTHDDMGLGSDGYQNVWLNQGEDAWANPNDPNTGNGVDDDVNGFTDDWKGWDFANGNNDGRGTFNHGTLVGGLVGAKTNNTNAVAGVAGGFGNEGAKIMICGVGDAAPNGAILDDAILYAAANGARIIQMSLTVGQSAAIDAALQSAYQTDGLLIICASGNGGQTSVGYPSSDGFVMAVGATDINDFRVGFSNHGPDLEISAPGNGIWSTDTGNGASSSSGTSFSAPITSGVAALVFSQNPALTNDEVRNILKGTADKVGGYDYNWNAGMPGHSFELGYGRVNAFEAVCAANAIVPDIYIKDSPMDVGNEPNNDSGEDIWGSVDIWNCVDDPNCATHQPPLYKAAGDNYLRVRIHNRTSTNSQVGVLHTYWSLTRTAPQWPDHWLHPNDPGNPGANTVNGNPAGGEITVVDELSFTPDPDPVPAIPPSGSTIITRPWQPPDPAGLLAGLPGTESPGTGLLARVIAGQDPIVNEAPGNTKANVVQNNNIATLNTYDRELFACRPASENTTVLVYNPAGSQAQFDLRIGLMAQTRGSGFSGDVILTLEQGLWDNWVNNGQASQNITLLGGNQVRMTATELDTVLQNIPVEAETAYAIGIEFRLPFAEGAGGSQDFRYMFSQVDAGADITGAMVFNITVSDRTFDNQYPLWPTITVRDLVPLVCDLP